MKDVIEVGFKAYLVSDLNFELPMSIGGYTLDSKDKITYVTCLYISEDKVIRKTKLPRECIIVITE